MGFIGQPDAQTTRKLRGYLTHQAVQHMGSTAPSYSESYDLYPGFWYTVGLGYGCWFHLDQDGDVDGKDLADLADGFGTRFDDTDIVYFAEEFGRSDCGLPLP